MLVFAELNAPLADCEDHAPRTATTTCTQKGQSGLSPPPPTLLSPVTALPQHFVVVVGQGLSPLSFGYHLLLELIGRHGAVEKGSLKYLPPIFPGECRGVAALPFV